MKIIHASDIHLGSKIKSLKGKTKERRSEIRRSFMDMIEYAKKNDVKIILLSGDVFDLDTPVLGDKEFFYAAVREASNIDFLYLRGNHDKLASSEEKEITNLKTFDSKWKTYSYDNIDITGVEINESNATSIYSSLSLNPDRINIVMLHGQESDASGEGLVNKIKLRNKNIDYLALGHIHSYKNVKLDDRGVLVYSGCLEGRGFDECGEKGFVLLDIDSKIDYTFIPISQREILEVKIDLSNATSMHDVIKSIDEDFKENVNNIFRVILTGDVSFKLGEVIDDVNACLKKKNCYYFEVKDETTKKINASDYEHDTSLKGEFIREVCASTLYTDDEKNEIIILGLKALEGRDLF